MSLLHPPAAGLPGHGFTQHARLLQLHTPLGPDVLLAERARIDESLCPAGGDDGLAGLRMEVFALSTDAGLDLLRLIGQPIRLDLATAAHGWRPFHAHVTQAERLGADGGLCRWRLLAQPWLSLLAHRQDSWVFQGLTVMQILEEVFADYAGHAAVVPAWRWDLLDPAAYPSRSLCIQYQETDLAFLERLLREEGLFYWFEHEAAPPGDPALGRHTLVIADHNGAFAPNAQACVRFTQSSAVLPEDSLHHWTTRAALAARQVHLASRDYRTLDLRPVMQASMDGTSTSTAPWSRGVQADVPGLYAYEDAAQGERLALRQVQALDAHARAWHGRGTVRTAAPGTLFTLHDHPVNDGTDEARDTFVIRAVTHRARANLGMQAAGALDRLLDRRVGAPPSQTQPTGPDDPEDPLYDCVLDAQPASRPFRVPGASLLHPRPTVHGTQTAVVVGLGPAGEDGTPPLHTDRDHRIKVQFHWQRGVQSSHRLAHPAGSNAPGTEGAGTWVRVLERIAGPNWGSGFLPRVGQEVRVAFVAGDIDRPVVIGSHYNGRGQTEAQGNEVAVGSASPWFPGHGHAAVHVGIKTQALGSSASGAGGYNQLVFDDTPGANRVELSTTQAQTWLQMGHLLQQQDNRHGPARGHGLELATAQWGAVRAGGGLLISAHGRPASTGQAGQMDAREPAAQLQQAQQALAALAASAHTHQARTPAERAGQALPADQGLQASVQSLAGTKGSAGAAGSAPSAGSRSADHGDAQPAPHPGQPQATEGGLGRIPAWSRPDLVVAAPAGIAQLTPEAAVWTAGHTASAIAQHAIDHLAQGHHATSAKDGIVLFTRGQAPQGERAVANTETGIALHAASGSVSTQSQAGATRLSADHDIEVSSTAASVHITAPKHVLLTAAGAAIRMEGGNITLNGPGKVVFKAGQKVFTGGASAPRPDAVMGHSEPLDLRHHLQHQFMDMAGRPLAHRPYVLILADGAIKTGKTDASGKTARIVTERREDVQIYIEDAEHHGYQVVTNP